MSIATQVHPLLLAEVNLAGQYNPPTFRDMRIPVYGFLILSGEDVILVDTGVGEGNNFIDGRFEPERRDLTEVLARFGVAPDDVTMLINSHLHFDHCGNNRLFPDVPVHVQAEELKAAEQPYYTIREWYDHDRADFRPVSGDHKLSAVIRLISTPGHTPGHQSVLVEASDGTQLVAAQAAFTLREFEAGGDPELQAHEGFARAYVNSLTKLKRLNVERVFFSHELATARVTNNGS